MRSIVVVVQCSRVCGGEGGTADAPATTAHALLISDVRALCSGPTLPPWIRGLDGAERRNGRLRDERRHPTSIGGVAFLSIRLPSNCDGRFALELRTPVDEERLGNAGPSRRRARARAVRIWSSSGLRVNRSIGRPRSLPLTRRREKLNVSREQSD